MIRALREYGYLKVRVCANVFKKKKKTKQSMCVLFFPGE